MTTTEKQAKVGGSFLVEDHLTSDIFVPEELTEDDRDLAQTVEDFVNGEVMPKVKELEAGDHELMAQILKKAGELGMLSAEVPEEFGGMDLSKRGTTLMSEKLSKLAGFTVSMGGHVGIGTMPITYFGNQAQKEKYLPKLATGELLAAYALSEASSGSDALNAKTKAVLNEAGTHYVLNGNKMWITNAGFADVFVVFAKIDGEDFSAFIVEKGFPGVSTGAEEKKMGIKSSSTRLLILEDAQVPVENLLGNRGEGHKIAFNILNIGRFKLGGACTGGSKTVLESSAQYAIDRQAFGKSISEFGMIKQKLADMAILTFAQECISYRTAGYIDDILSTVDYSADDANERILKGVQEYAMECAMVKVYCTDKLDDIADEGVQIHGGYGYSAEYDVERMYRDSRINRIFEGTNEINRMLSVDMLVRKAMKGELPLMEKAMGLMSELMGMPSFDMDQDMSLLAEEKKMVANAKKICIFLAGAGFKKFMEKISEEQELLGMAADLFIETYVMESALLRTLKVAEMDGEETEKVKLMIDATKVLLHDSMERIATIAKTGLASFEDGDTLMTMNAALRRLVKHPAVNTVAARRRIADAVIAKKGYMF